MANRSFSIKEAFSFGWQTTKKNFGYFVLLLILTAATLGVASYVQNSVAENYESAFFLILIINILVWVVDIIVQMGLIKISIRFVEGKKSKYLDLYHTKSFINYVLVSIITGIIVGVGLIIFIIPGIILGIKLQFANYLVVDKDYGVRRAIKESWQMTKDVKWRLFLLGLLILIINLAGFFALMIGLFLTIPLTFLANAFVYRKLLLQTATK